MRMKIEDFPINTVTEISLNSEKSDHIRQEVPSNKELENVINNPYTNSFLMDQQAMIPDEVSTRYQFSN